MKGALKGDGVRNAESCKCAFGIHFDSQLTHLPSFPLRILCNSSANVLASVCQGIDANRNAVRYKRLRDDMDLGK